MAVTNKTVLITGCSSGFGNLLVGEYLKRGWNVIATMRRAATRDSLFSDLQKTFAGQLNIVSLDVTSGPDRLNISKFIEDKFDGRLDCLVNNAGFAVFGPMEEASEKQIRDQMEVNFFGTALLAKELLPYLRARQGRIINLSSLLGYTGMPMSSLYCASKFAVEGLSEALYYELRPYGVQVTLVEPGGHRTRFADNAQWTKRALHAESPYYQQTKAFRGLHDRLKTHDGVAPVGVVSKIIAVSECKKAPLRVKCGKDAILLNFMKKILPSEILAKILRPVYRKLMEQKVVNDELG